MNENKCTKMTTKLKILEINAAMKINAGRKLNAK